MRIAVNARFLIRDKSDGISAYSIQTLKRICPAHPEHRFVFLFDRPYDPEFIFSENIIPVVLSPPARHPLLWYWWFEFSVSVALKKYQADLFFSPDGFNSLKTSVPSIIVIHDINFFHRPFDLPFLVRRYYNYFFPRYADKALKICTVSEFSKHDIASSFHIPADKIDVHYNGINPDFGPIDEKEKRSVREKYTNGKPFFVFIGNLHPRKNLVGLLKGFDHFREQAGTVFRLVIAGREIFLNKQMKKIYREMVYKDDVIFTGHLPSVDIAGLVASSEALAFVSHYEGFGLPVLEAMISDIPVIVSDKTSLPEIAGDAALYVDPDNYLSISDAMMKLVSAPELRRELIGKGRLRAQQFSWDKTAEGLWTTIKSVINEHA